MAKNLVHVSTMGRAIAVENTSHIGAGQRGVSPMIASTLGAFRIIEDVTTVGRF